ncbi:hypothetical protein L7F22_051368 [Adiantum nelumboides]|nr:hypothetical protein [Adiantum nelumboides]
MNPLLTPCSPSLDMEAALEHLSSNCDSELSRSRTLLDDPDILMVDPFLDYLNEVLMEEQGEQDALCMQADVEASYKAIISSFYDIVSESLPLNSSSSEPISNPHVFYENVPGVHSSHPWDENSHQELYSGINKSYDALSILPRESHTLEVSSNCVAACCDFDASLGQKNAVTLCAQQEVIQDSSRAYNGSFESLCQ